MWTLLNTDLICELSRGVILEDGAASYGLENKSAYRVPTLGQGHNPNANAAHDQADTDEIDFDPGFLPSEKLGLTPKM